MGGRPRSHKKRSGRRSPLPTPGASITVIVGECFSEHTAPSRTTKSGSWVSASILLTLLFVLTQVPRCCRFKTPFPPDGAETRVIKEAFVFVFLLVFFFLVGAFLSDPALTPKGRCCCQCSCFPKGPRKPRASRLCQDFLAKMLICLPSRLQLFCLVFELRACMCVGGWGWWKGILGIISIPGYTRPFLVIQYQNRTLYSRAPPGSSDQQR